MARPIKNNADYFSHDNDMRDDERIKAVRRKYSHLGYSTWNMLLERLCKAENFKVQYNEESLDLMAGDFNIDPEQLKEIIDYLIKLKLIIFKDEIIFSQTMINRFAGLLRKRKRDSEKLSLAITPNEDIIALDNTQSKVKESKVKKRKVKKIKEKGKKENPAPVFLEDFFYENEKSENDFEREKNNYSNPSEKSSAKKDHVEAIFDFKKIFETFAPKYVWEAKDEHQLVLLLKKICITKPELKLKDELSEAFLNFLRKLPEYWKTKKFTIPNLNSHYNEIVSEIRANKKPVHTKANVYKPLISPEIPDPPKEKTPEEKIQIKKDFIKSICDRFKLYVTKGDPGITPMWVMFDVLTEEKILKLSDTELSALKNEVIRKRKSELRNPKNPAESKAYKAILENFQYEITQGLEKNKIEIAAKSLAVQRLFDELKRTKTDIKKLFKK